MRRRDFFRVSAGTGLGILLAGCGAATSSPPSSASAPSLSQVSASSAAKPSVGAPSAASVAARSAASAAVATSGNRDKVTVALPSIVQSQAPYLIAHEKNYYSDEGLDVELSAVAPNLGVQGVAGGAYTFSGAAAQAAISKLSGAPLKVVFNHSSSITWWLMANQKSGVTSVEGLKGKSIAVEGPGTLSMTFTQAVLRKHGLNPDTDVSFTSAGAVTNWLTPVLGNAVDAGIAASSDVYLASKRNGLVEVTWYGRELHAPLSGIATSDALLKDKADLARRFLRGSIKGLRAYRANKDEAVRILAPLIKQPADQVAKAYDVEAPLMLDDPIIDDATLRDFLQIAKETLKLAAAPNPSDVYSYDLTRQAIRELASEGWKPA